MIFFSIPAVRFYLMINFRGFFCCATFIVIERSNEPRRYGPVSITVRCSSRANTRHSQTHVPTQSSVCFYLTQCFHHIFFVLVDIDVPEGKPSTRSSQKLSSNCSVTLQTTFKLSYNYTALASVARAVF